ncbi:MAG: hypothetical protein JXN61_10875 [Sedimentisphaerales bacterium]|nr:hypothetical protein [Sedimentisphaerales bacterium]
MPAGSTHSRTLFHFTSQAGLIGILESNFRSSFSRERMSVSGAAPWDYWVPMVCFCDIPLHLIGDHISHYGQYGLGLSREWAIRSKLNPVTYYQPNSAFFEQFSTMMSLQHTDYSGLASQNVLIESTRDIYLKSRYLLQYYKPWLGHDFKTNSERRFYDEREWRYVPLSEGTIDAIYGATADFEAQRDEYFNKLHSPYLVFEPKDISCVVLRDESERYDTVQRLRNLKKKYSMQDVETLVSKIITVEQIEADI